MMMNDLHDEGLSFLTQVKSFLLQHSSCRFIHLSTVFYSIQGSQAQFWLTLWEKKCSLFYLYLVSVSHTTFQLVTSVHKHSYLSCASCNVLILTMDVIVTILPVITSGK